MTMISPPNASANGDAGRQRSLIARGEWEACWLSEQRTACAVVQYRDNPSGAEHDSSRLQRAPEIDANTEMSRGQTAAKDAPNTRAYERAAGNVMPASAEGVRTRLTLQASASAPTGLLQPPIESPLGTATGPTRAEQATAAAPTPFRNSASWRHDDGSLSVAMRVRDPEAVVRGVIPQLREWLREAGGQLRRLIVNGRTVLGAEDTRSADSNASPSTRPDTHIYKE